MKRPKYLTDLELQALEYELEGLVTSLTKRPSIQLLKSIENRCNTIIKALEDHNRVLSRPPLKLIK